MPSTTRRRGSWHGLLSGQWAVAAVLLAVAAGLVIRYQWLSEWDSLFYDQMVRLDTRPAPDDVILVAIDETSLEALGRWPWPRYLHTELVRRLSEGGASVVILDILFTEPDTDSPASDAALAQAIADAGNLVLPLANVERYAGGPLMELLPIPPLTPAAAALGHTDLPLDKDGIARSVFLRGGLGEPHWSSLALAALETLGVDPLARLATEESGIRDKNSPLVWTRNHRVGIPFIGPPGHFHQVSFADVLSGAVPSEVFAGKVVLVGATAAGLGDTLPTPVSGLSRPMPGVEIVANLFEGLRTGRTITTLSRTVQVLASITLILAALFLFPRTTPQMALATGLVFMAAIPLLSFVLLTELRWWFPPVTALGGVLAGYILWSWNRLIQTLTFLNQEIRRLGEEPTVLGAAEKIGLSAAIPYLQNLLPVRGALLLGPGDRLLDQWGSPPPPFTHPPADQWVRHGNALWKRLGDKEKGHVLGLHWDDPAPLTPRDVALIDNLASRYHPASHRPPQGPVEFLQAKIWAVQQATARLQTMRRLIGESLSQLASGILVVDNLGTVRLHNAHAAELLTGDAQRSLMGHPLDNALGRVEFDDTDAWPSALQTLYHSRRGQTLNAAAPGDRQLLLQVGPFADATDAHLDGIIIDVVDITDVRNAERRRREMMSFLSHDLRAPLTSILGITQLAHLKAEPLDRIKVARIEAHARKTLELADNFLHLARDEHEEALVLEVVDLGTLAHHAVEQVGPQALEKSLSLATRTGAGPCEVLGNEGLLERVFINLLTNAIKYSPAGSAIEVSIQRESGQAVIVRVKDNGYGIPEEQVPRLFGRYETFRRGDEASGTGLGLAFVKRVVDQHGATIAVSSRPGVGTTFEIRFPAAPESVRNAAPQA